MEDPFELMPVEYINMRYWEDINRCVCGGG